MTLATLRTELKARGLDHLSDARANSFLNDAYRELNSAADWPWLLATTSGPAPLTISDVKQVLKVNNTTQKTPLQSMDIRQLVDQDGDFSSTFTPNTTGTPWAWWLEGLSTLRVYPASTTDTIAVLYLKRPATLSADGDTPIVPTEYHTGLVDIAEAMALAKDESDDKDQSIVRSEVQTVVGYMTRDFLDRNLDAPGWLSVAPGNSSDW